MRKKKKLTRAQKIAKKYSDGFNVMTYSLMAQLGIALLFLFGSVVFSAKMIGNSWIGILIIAFSAILGFILGQKMTEATVNLKVTSVGLEQTRIAGSFFVPLKRIVEWKDMRWCRLWGEFRRSSFFIRTKKGRNYRLMTEFLFRKMPEQVAAFFHFQDEFEHQAIEQHIVIKDSCKQKQ